MQLSWFNMYMLHWLFSGGTENFLFIMLRDILAIAGYV